MKFRDSPFSFVVKMKTIDVSFKPAVRRKGGKEEMRLHPRVKAFNLAKIHQPKLLRELISNIINISDTGLAFVSQDPFELDTYLEIRIHVPGGDELDLTASVARCEPVHKQKHLWEVGVSFLNVSGHDSEFVRTLL